MKKLIITALILASTLSGCGLIAPGRTQIPGQNGPGQGQDPLHVNWGGTAIP